MTKNSTLINVTINGKKYSVNLGMTILQACELNKISIPKFCYHSKLSIAGNCRMCLVELAKSAKLVASCATPCLPDQEIFTTTDLVQKTRENIVEFLLINHPLDCPICDQGGECDLQDQTMNYGSDRGRFFGIKRVVEEKECGVLIKTFMTRCIHCTRCVRFVTELASDIFFGTVGRGRQMKISSYVEKIFTSELSGNVIDLCPVGALTARPYTFLGRSWELKSVDSIDILDGIGSNIRVDIRGVEIMRVLPRLNNFINEEWLSDKSRFSFDGLKLNRNDFPLIKKNFVSFAIKRKMEFNVKVGFFRISWYRALMELITVFTKTKPFSNTLFSNFGTFFVGNFIDSFSFLIFKVVLSFISPLLPLFSFLPYNVIQTPISNSFMDLDLRSNYGYNQVFNVFETSELIVLVNVNPRFEATLFNLRLRKYFLKNNILVASIGAPLNLTFPVSFLGISLKVLVEIVEGKHAFCKNFLKKKNAQFIFGTNHTISFSNSFFLFFSKIFTKLFFFITGNSSFSFLNFLSTSGNEVGLFDIGYKNKSLVFSKKQMVNHSNFAFFYNFDPEFDCTAKNREIFNLSSKKNFNIYLGHHRVMAQMDLFLPSLAFTEKKGFFCNTEKRYQCASKVTNGPGKAKDDFFIFLTLMNLLFFHFIEDMSFLYKQNNFWCSVSQLHFNFFGFFVSFGKSYLPYVFDFNVKTSFFPSQVWFLQKSNSFFTCFFNFQQTFQHYLGSFVPENYYLTNIISRNSIIMAQCNKLYIKSSLNFNFSA